GGRPHRAHDPGAGGTAGDGGRHGRPLPHHRPAHESDPPRGAHPRPGRAAGPLPPAPAPRLRGARGRGAARVAERMRLMMTPFPDSSTPPPAPSPLAVPALQGRRVVLGVSGSIAAYKAADLASRLVRAGARVDVIMTRSATRFITPLTSESLVGQPLVTVLFTPAESPIDHVSLAREA